MDQNFKLPAIPLISSIAPLAANRLAWLVDIWGVMHNGVRPYERAVDACQKFRAEGGTVLLLSNAPRPAPSVAEQLDRIGVARSAYDSILTSGDAARALIQEATASGARLAHLGPERDRPLFAGLSLQNASLEDADVVVCTGLFDDETETPDTYASLLAGMMARGARMICANPDQTVERGGRIVYCAGAIAAAYEKLGGNVSYAGKPFAPVYRLAHERIEHLRGHDVRSEQFLAIGDGIKTDIAGAAGAGIDSVYIASGIHVWPSHVLDAGTLSELFPTPSVRPIAAMTELAW